MVKAEFKALIDSYRRATQGNPIDDNQLFAASVSFLENLKFALADGSLTRQEGLGMLGILKQYSTEYDQERAQSRGSKPVRTIKETTVRNALKKKLAVLVKELGQFFQENASSQQAEQKAPGHRS